jgi:hypothetical protein|tara:strand:- start:1697 stop:1975 length:279 start_codon:yes stop_codon:yes gene_type:complete
MPFTKKRRISMDIYLLAAIVATLTYMFIGRELLNNIFPNWRYWIGLETVEESLGFGEREVGYIPMEDIGDSTLKNQCDHHPALVLSDCYGCF